MITTLLATMLTNQPITLKITGQRNAPFIEKLSEQQATVLFNVKSDNSIIKYLSHEGENLSDTTERDFLTYDVQVISSHNSEISGNYKIIDMVRGRMGPFMGKLEKGKTYVAIVNVSNENDVKIPNNTFIVHTPQPSMIPVQIMQSETKQLITDDNPQLSLLYTYVHEALNTSDKDTHEVLLALHSQAPRPYGDFLRSFHTGKINQMSGPSQWLFDQAKAAPPRKKLMLLEVLNKWNMTGWQEEFIKAYKLVKDDQELPKYINLEKIRLQNYSVPERDQMIISQERLFDLIEQTSIVDGKIMFMHALRNPMELSRAEKKRLAKMLNHESEKLVVFMCNTFANLENQPDKKIKDDMEPAERQALIETMVNYWKIFYDIV